MAEERHVKIVASVEGGPTIERTFRGSAEAVDEVETAAASASVRLEQMEGDALEAGAGVRRAASGGEEALEDLAAGARRTGEVVGEAGERGAQALRSMSRGAGQAGGRVSSFSKSGGTANQVLFEMAAATQDAQYGFRGVSNQIPQLVEMITRLKTQAGGTRGAMGALLGALKGPAGLIAGFAALEFASSTLGPMIVKAFSSGSAATEEFKERASEAADAILSIRSRVEELQAELSVDEAEGLVKGLDKSEERLKSVRRTLASVRAATRRGYAIELDASEYESLRAQLEDTLDLTRLVSEEQRGGARFYEISAERAQQINGALEEQGLSHTAIGNRLERIDKLRAAQEDRLKDIRELQEARNIAEAQGVEFAESMEQAIAAAADKTGTAIRRYREFESEVATTDAFQDLSDAEVASRKVEVLQRALQALQEEGVDPAASGVVALREELRQMRRAASESAKPTQEELQTLREAESVRRAVQVAAMEEGFEKRLAQIDFEIDQEIEKYREQYAGRFPAVFAEIETLLNEQRQQLKRRTLPAAPEIPVFKWTAPELPEGKLNLDEAELLPEPPKSLGEAWEAALGDKIDPALSRTRETLQATREEIERLEATGQDTGKLRGLEQDLMQAEAALMAFQAGSEVATGAIEQSFAVLGESIGESIAGIADQTKSISEKLVLVLARAASTLGEVLVSIGTPLLFVPGMQGTAAAYLAGGTALMALGSLLGASASGGPGQEGSGGGQDRRGPVERRVNANEGTVDRGYARGTGSAEEGWALVGEEGPELIHMAGGEAVLTNANTREVLRGVNAALAMGVEAMQRPSAPPRRRPGRGALGQQQPALSPAAREGQQAERLELVGTSTPRGDIQYALQQAERQQRRQGTDDL